MTDEQIREGEALRRRLAQEDFNHLRNKIDLGGLSISGQKILINMLSRASEHLPALIAEVRRLKEENDRLRWKLHEKTALTNVGGKLDGMTFDVTPDGLKMRDYLKNHFRGVTKMVGE